MKDLTYKRMSLTHQQHLEAQKGFREQDSRFICLAPGCTNTFGRQKDLKRHQKMHNPASPLWYCGCCLNVGVAFEGLYRKDKLQDHMKKRHKIFRVYKGLLRQRM